MMALGFAFPAHRITSASSKKNTRIRFSSFPKKVIMWKKTNREDGGGVDLVILRI